MVENKKEGIYNMKKSDIVLKLAKEIQMAGGRAYYVGGYVRDLFLDKENKDIDIEVYNISPEKLKSICSKFGKVDEVGVSFGVLKIHGYDLDITMPRRERQIGSGHKDFSVSVDPFMGTREAASRRDFTMNALMKDILTGEIVDHFEGTSDLKGHIIRHISDETFIEDPLRVFRAAGFAARLNFKIHEETLGLCKNIDISELSRERIFEETNKVLKKAKKPSVYFNYLYDMGKLDVFFPGIAKLHGIPQDPVYHPEGDAFIHTMKVLDHAAIIRKKVENPLGFMYSALFHDIGKLETTMFDKQKKRWTSIDHDLAGMNLAEKEMQKVTSDKNLIRYVKNMVGLHMQPAQITQDAKPKTTNRMFDKCLCPNDLFLLSVCDQAGRKDISQDTIDWWIGRLKRYYSVIGRPEVTGDDLILLGYKPGPEFSRILEKCHAIHLAEVPKEDVIRQIPSILNGIGLKGYGQNCLSNVIRLDKGDTIR